MEFVLKYHLFFILFILYSTFHLIISNNFQENFTGNHTFNFSIESTGGKKFGEFLLEGKVNSKYVLSAYSEESKEKRIQLGLSYKGKIQLYLSLKDYKNIYIEIECPKDNDCSGDIYYSFIDKIRLTEGQPITYYVNRDNETIEFSLDFNSEKSNIWARGQYYIKTQLGTNIPKTIENRGDFYIFEGRMTDVSFIVKPTKGDYINVGYMGYNRSINYDSNKKIEIDGPILTGYLKKDVLDEICYTINKENILNNEQVLGNGIIFTKIGYSYITSQNVNESQSGSLYTSGFIKNGIFLKNDFKEDFKICITFPNSSQYNKIKEIVYTYQLEKAIKNNITLYEPQLNGVFYSKNLQKGSKTTFISQNNGNFKNMSLNLMSLDGFPTMYVIQCENFPLCDYDNITLSKSICPRNINRFSSLYVNKEEGFDDSPISKNQTIFVVECMRNQNITDKDFSPICNFNTLIYKDNDYIELFEDYFFNQFVLQNQIQNYKIKIAKQSNIKKIFIDIILYVGDVDVNITNLGKNGLKADLYYQINKIFISVKINGNSEYVEDLDFSVKGINNTYYTTLITFANQENEVDSLITNKLQTGISYLVTIDTSKYDQNGYSNKIIKFKNERTYDFMPFMVNFYSLNCEIDGFTIYEEKTIKMEKFEQFSHDVVNVEEERYLSSEYEYRIKVISSDPSKYNGNLCKIYASAIELSEFHEAYSRDILIPDNIPQQIRFGNDVKHVSFGYIHVDFQYNLLVKFNLKNVAQYTIKFYYENYEREKGEVKIASNNLLILKSDEWSSKACKDKIRICYITLDITLEKTKDDNDKPLLEFSIKSLNTHSINYIPKNQLKIYYVRKDIPQHYYTEIGSDEYGVIIANFLRGSGIILARIVKSIIDTPEENAIWRGKYRFPNENEEIKIEPFIKKLEYETTNDCEDGCYLLLSVFSDYNIQYDIYSSYSLIVHSLDRYFKNIPIIKIPVDQYIIGSVYPSLKSNMSHFYSVWLYYDADQIIIDFQSDSAGIFINVGKTRPTLNNSNFEYWSRGNNTLFKIEKQKIMNYVDESQKEKGLKDIILTIGIWTDMTEYNFPTLFSFSVRLKDDKENEIYRVNSDKMLLCNPKRFNEKYRCIFIIDYNIYNYYLLFIYANAQDKSSSINIYADFINAVKYEMSSKNELNNFIPKKETNPTFSTENTNKDYFYIISSENDEGNYLIISVEVNKETIIEFMTTNIIVQNEISPNPYSPQLYAVFPGNIYYLNFPDIYMEMVNIICIDGEGEIYWNFDADTKYKLKGKDNRLLITSNSSNKPHKLYIKGIGDSDIENVFIFIVHYNIRNDFVNYDELNLERKDNYIYVDNKFPFVYYIPLIKFNEKMNNNDDYYEFLFTLNIKEQTYLRKKNSKYYDNHPFKIHGFIVKEQLLYNLKVNKTITLQIDEKTIFGFYDHALRTGLIKFTQENKKKSTIDKYDKPYLCIKLDEELSFKNKNIYKKIIIGTSVSYSNSNIPISEISNKFGYLNSKQNEANYILRNNNKYQYMYLEFSCIDENLSVYIDKGSLNNNETKYGKTIYYIETIELNNLINLSIKRNNEQDNDSIQYFMLRYTFDNIINKNKYIIEDTKLTISQSKNESHSNFTVQLHPLEIPNSKPNDYIITYIVRLFTEKESKPKKSNIVLKPTEQIIKEYYNPRPREGETLLEFKISKVDNKKVIKYIEVNLKIEYNESIEYLSYDLQELKNDYIDSGNENKNKNNNNILLITISIISVSIIFIIIIVLIIVIIIYNKKNKGLLKEVENISFLDTDKKKEDDIEPSLILI